MDPTGIHHKISWTSHPIPKSKPIQTALWHHKIHKFWSVGFDFNIMGVLAHGWVCFGRNNHKYGLVESTLVHDGCQWDPSETCLCWVLPITSNSCYQELSQKRLETGSFRDGSQWDPVTKKDALVSASFALNGFWFRLILFTGSTVLAAWNHNAQTF